MKYTYTLASILALALLASCNSSEDTQNAEQEAQNPVASISAVEQEAQVLVEISNDHPLAGETLNFEVELMSITKAEGNAQEDTVEPGDSIEVHYVGTLNDGTTFDSSRERDETLPFTVSAGQMIPGFDAGVLGMTLGEVKTLVIEPEQAYGPKTFTQTYMESEFDELVAQGFVLEPGAVIPVEGGEITVVEIIK